METESKMKLNFKIQKKAEILEHYLQFAYKNFLYVSEHCSIKWCILLKQSSEFDFFFL